MAEFERHPTREIAGPGRTSVRDFDTAAPRSTGEIFQPPLAARIILGRLARIRRM